MKIRLIVYILEHLQVMLRICRPENHLLDRGVAHILINGQSGVKRCWRPDTTGKKYTIEDAHRHSYRAIYSLFELKGIYRRLTSNAPQHNKNYHNILK